MDDFYKKYEKYCEYFPEFQYRLVKDDFYFFLLHKEFPQTDIFEEFKVFHIWLMDLKKPPSHLRLAFRNWLKRKNKKS